MDMDTDMDMDMEMEMVGLKDSKTSMFSRIAD
jgi:hypothetical protein